MKHKIITFLCSILLLTIGCNNNDSDKSYTDTDENYSQDNDNETEDGDYKDGKYCAEVEYYNPSTGTKNSYSLDVEVEGGKLTVIHWPNSGWLDNSHFIPEDISEGECQFTSDRGYRYTVTLGERGGCVYSDGYKIRRDVNNEIEETACPKCGGEKDSYDDYCDDCQDKIDHTCKRCGQVDNLMFSTDDYCSDCEDKLENICSSCGSYEYRVNGGLCSSCKSDREY